jgi:hypothetical protein
MKAPVITSSADPAQLQSSLLALADTSIARIGNEALAAQLGKEPDKRREVLTLRLVLVSAMLGIVTGPDPVDGLLDVLTHTTLVAEAMRKSAEGKPAGSPEARFAEATRRNAEDAWKLAEHWLDQPTRDALRARIMEASKAEGAAVATAAYMRLSDLPRTGSQSIDAGSGMFDAMHAAAKQADQIRLLGERSLFLMQRMPFLMRWQAEAFTDTTLGREDVALLIKRLDALALSTDQAAKMVAGMPGTLSKERAAALDDLFQHIQSERQATLEQLAVIVRNERKATLDNVAQVVTDQRKAALEDVTGLAGMAESKGSTWVGTVLLVGVLLIAVLLGGLLGTLLMYRRLAPKVDRA